MRSLNDLVKLRIDGDYQRDNFDYFLKKRKFVFLTPAIHVSGTNGKGSTANYLASVYAEAGYKVGLFTSPFLKDINEMVVINGCPISDECLNDIIVNNKKEIEKCELSFFEVMTYVAFTYFDEQQCDLAIIECGMGGLIDATNVFIPVLSIITSVSLEHTAFLGRSITEIAFQKAGIIKEEVPVLTGDLSEEVLEVVSKYAGQKKSPVHVVSIPNNVLYDDTGYTFDYQTINNLKISSLALYSVNDACLALEALLLLKDIFPVNEEQIASGLYNVKMPARMEIIHDKPCVLIDGAHNPEAMENLYIAIQKVAKSRAIHVVFACFKDKNFLKMLSYLGQIGDVFITTFPHPRARIQEDYFIFANEYPYYPDPLKLIDDLMNKFPDDLILVTGSLAFAGYIRDVFKKEES